MTERYFPDGHLVAGSIFAGAKSSGSANGTAVDAHGFGRACAIANLGAIASAGSVAMYNSAASAGSYTAITDATYGEEGDVGDNSLVLIDFPISNTYPWIRAYYSVAGTWNLGVSIVLYKPNRSTPPTQLATSTVHA